jgi:RHS repeat-associated protein
VSSTQLVQVSNKLNDGYRFGYNGKENDKEIDGQQDYGMRIYDNRIGRFKSVDPLTRKFPMLTPYQFASNSPITNIDLDGLEATNNWAAIKAKVMGIESLKMNNAEDVSDIQQQQNRLIIQNPTLSVKGLYNKIATDIGSIYNTDYGAFKFEKQIRRNKVSAGDYIRINPSQKGLADIFVKVVGASSTYDLNGNITDFNMQFRTLEGHVEVGTINFSSTSMTDVKGNSYMHFMIESTSQIDPAVAQTLSGMSKSIRNQQVDNWSQTMGNILKATGGKKAEASVYIETYENGVFNKDFKKKKDDGFSIGAPNGDPKSVEQRTLPATEPKGN